MFHENCVLALLTFFFLILGKMSENLSSAAAVIGALRANPSWWKLQIECDFI